MRVSYMEAMMTPHQVMLNDLEMINLEAMYSKKPPEQAQVENTNQGT